MNETEILAVWGATTGTIGTLAGLLNLWLRFRQFKSDKPRLKCSSSFEFKSPTSLNHKITIRSTGRRPVLVDSIYYFIDPPNWKQKIRRRWLHKQGRWLYKQKIDKTIKLEEGEKVEIPIKQVRGLDITKVHKVNVIDQTDRAWSVEWPSTTDLKKTATQEQLTSVKDSSKERSISIDGHRLGEKLYIEAKFHCESEIRLRGRETRMFWFMDKERYQAKLENLRDVQAPKFLVGKIKSIET